MVLTEAGIMMVLTLSFIEAPQKALSIMATTFLPPIVSGISYTPFADGVCTPVITTALFVMEGLAE